jgi:hypothetical protein
MKLHAIIFSMLLAICAQANNTTNLTEEDRQVFIETFAQLAVDEMLNYGIPSSITLAQAILESSWGQGETAMNANNYFGIKCYNGWEGPTFFAMDDEPDKSCFRKYNDVVQSFRDHSIFLKDGLRYRQLFENSVTDYSAWARGLKNCGYATDPEYAEKLIGIIERYGLFVYDYAMPLDRIEVVDAPMQSAVVSAAVEEMNTPSTTSERTIGSAILKAPTYKLAQLPGEGFFDQPAGHRTDYEMKPAAVKQDDEPRIIVVEPVYEVVWD